MLDVKDVMVEKTLGNFGFEIRMPLALLERKCTNMG
jgi:hypothetical protein